jgi:ATP-binding cassette subfamily B protein
MPEGSLSIYTHGTRLLCAIILLFAFQSVAYYLRTYLFGILAHRIVKGVRSRLYESLIRKKISFFDASRSSDLVSRLTSDTLLIQEAIGIRISVLIRYLLQLVQGFVLMLLLSPRLSVLLLGALPPIMVVSMILGKRLREYSKKQQRLLGECATIAEETFGAIRTVKAFRAIPFEIDRFGLSLSALYETLRARTAVSAFMQSFVTFLMNAFLALIGYYAFSLVLDGVISWGDLTAFGMYGATVALSAGFVISGISEIFQAFGAIDRVREFSSEADGERTDGSRQQFSAPPQITFRSVDFEYPTREGVQVLKGIDLAIPGGSIVALVGPSGSGKSSILQLLLGFYEPTGGSILVDNYDTRTLSLDLLRSLYAFVPQEPALMSGSIRQNLLMGQRSASDEEILAACKKVNLHSFIESLADGLQTQVGERGLQLSGGQKQRLAIARALLVGAKILVLDEATAALDADNESLLQEQFQQLKGVCSMVIVAHRLATVQAADTIFVVEDGKISQCGTHAELAATPGTYQNLVRQQNLK